MKHYTFVTTHIIKAPSEALANAAMDALALPCPSPLRPNVSVVERWTKLTDIEDVRVEN